LYLAVVVAVVAGAMAVHAQDSPIDVLRQEWLRREQQQFDQQYQQRARPRAVNRPRPAKIVKPRASPFSRPAPQPVAQPQPAPAVPPSIFISVIGDTLADLLADGLKTQFQDRPDIAVEPRTKASSGLVRDDFYDWGNAVAGLVASGDKIDAAV